MAASAKLREVNPLDYVFQALEIKMDTVGPKESEYLAISKYLNSTSESSHHALKNIYRIQRRGEAERMSKWKEVPNHYLLWHGSRTANFIGILSEGLRVAPPSAARSGAAYGKGIYFADMVAKSVAYCRSSSGQSAFLLLSEVALGKMRSSQKTSVVEELPSGYHSLVAHGRKGPSFEESIVLPNGVTIPIGAANDQRNDGKMKYLNYYSEYIVPDVSQVRLRYLVEITV